ncbi:MAG TPA: hypothetical protein VGK29_12745 [Paludibaculum sp.]|jgi:hypothetical protein
MTYLVQEYAQSLAALTGNEFQCEVCARLQSAILGFQTIPAKPQGDAGLDGFSHNGQRGYCCYGPEHDEFKTAKQRENAIVDKFKSDLRRLCELDFNKKKLVCIESQEMATILPDGCKLMHITLLVNWFESHRILNPLFSAFNEYKTTSVCRYVEAGASLNVLGPKELANAHAVDESTILRARQRVFAQRVQHAAQNVKISDPKDFDSKMATLREIRPDQVAAINGLAEQFRTDWKMSLAFERELDETAPTLHLQLEENRRRILRDVSQLMIGAPEPWKELGKASGIAKEILDCDFGKLCGSIVHDVSSGEIARLIGECPVGWEKPASANG